HSYEYQACPVPAHREPPLYAVPRNSLVSSLRRELQVSRRRRKSNVIAAYSVVAFAWRWWRLLRLFKMGSRWRYRDLWFGSDNPAGLLPRRRYARPALNETAGI